jgi:hypothetical protein
MAAALQNYHDEDGAGMDSCLSSLGALSGISPADPMVKQRMEASIASGRNVPTTPGRMKAQTFMLGAVNGHSSGF